MDVRRTQIIVPLFVYMGILVFHWMIEVQYFPKIIHQLFFHNFSVQQGYFQSLLNLSESSIIRCLLRIHDIDLKCCTIELVHSINFKECTKTITT